jgi:hypothetical protein
LTRSPSSTQRRLDPKENDQLRAYLSEIGARLSDAFGADDILWVEGPTEEICLPLILEKVARCSLMGTAVIGVKHTGDLESKHAKTVFEIYERLSKGRGLLPPAVGFIFDREDRPDHKLDELRRNSNGMIEFTPRRLYENYLLDPAAIASVANDIEGFRDPPLTEPEVRAWIDAEVKSWIDGDLELRKKYGAVPADHEKWRDSIHAAHLLERLFMKMSGTRVSYRKTEHSVALTRWLIEHRPEDLRELADLAKGKLEDARKRSSPGTQSDDGGSR